jgi:hypothetical protein
MRVPGAWRSVLPSRSSRTSQKACTSSKTVGTERMSSTLMDSCVSQPLATRRTRLATASISCSRRRPSTSSSVPAAVSCAWRELRSKSSTSSASSSWRTL